MTHSIDSILKEISDLALEKRKSMYIKQGIKEEIYGVNLGDLRKIANKLKTNHDLAEQLWETNIYEARVIACILFDSKQLNLKELNRLILSTQSGPVIDELSFQMFELLDNQLELFDLWIHSDNPRFKRAGWNMGIILNHDLKLDNDKINKILDYIDNNLSVATNDYQFAMNRCLSEIGIKHDHLTQRCISIGEKHGVYKEMKVSKGCTSPYAPIWISVVRKKYNKS